MTARSFFSVVKDAGANAVHAVTALGNERGKAKRFKAIISGVKHVDPDTVTQKHASGDDPAQNFRIAKVDKNLGLVFGWAIVCKVKGEDYYDLNVDQAGPHKGERVPEHIPEDAMVKAAVDFAEAGAPGNEMHDGPDVGSYVFLFPMTTDVAKAMGIETEKTGLMVAYKPTPEVLEKFADGTYTGFSIEGRRLKVQEIE